MYNTQIISIYFILRLQWIEMRRSAFLDRLKYLNLTQKDFSVIAGCSYQTVKQWKDGKIPKWVFLLLDHIEILQSAKRYTLR